MSVEILEKTVMGDGGQYLKVRVSDHKALMDFKFNADDVVDVVPTPTASEEEKMAIRGVCKNWGYTFVEKEKVAGGETVPSDEGKKK